MREKIYIRADGSLAKGLGHLTRCIALAKMLTSEFESIFVCREIPESIFCDLSRTGFEVNLVTTEDHFFSLITNRDMVVLDDYSFDIEYQTKVKSLCRKLIFIDDLHEMEFVADLIINHAPGVSYQDYKAIASTEYALGLDYVLLRPPFLEQARKKREISIIQSVMICFGGADYKNLTYSTTSAIMPFKEFRKIIIITGPAYDQSESLNELLNNDNRIIHYHSVNEDEMLSLMLQSELAIVPSSAILLEALAAGCGAISGTYAENQQIIFERFLKFGAFESAENFSTEEIVNAVKAVLDKPGYNKRLIDGLSSKRILRKIIGLTISIREVEADDCKLLFSWANEAGVRMNATSTYPIEWNEHVNWFSKILLEEESRLFILDRSGKPAGQARFDLNEGHYIIDYSVDKNFRGQGFGKIMLEKSMNLIGKAKFKAIVKTENLTSIAVFNSLNFEERETYMDKGTEYRIFQLNHN